ncbi:MAG: hypothetical protein ACKV2V_14250, partial [Blastocatellia bacterium]
MIPRFRPACRYSAMLCLTFCLLFCLPPVVRAQTQQPPVTQPSGTSTKPADKPDEPKTPEAENRPSTAAGRTDLNLAGKTDTSAGESRRNENVQFNLVDNGALKELNIRLGVTATIVREFAPVNGYFGAEFGNAPRPAIVVPVGLRAGIHGMAQETHQNSVFTARSFFQVGAVQPARENDYGFNLGMPLWGGAKLFIEAGQQKVRGIVNGNVLVPQPDERTPLTNDPAARAIVARFLAAYPKQLPNRTDINPRALNTNAPQTINSDQAGARLEQKYGARDALFMQYQFTSQSVDAFQLVAGQNPNTDTKSHLGRITWTRQWNPATVSYLSASYDRVSSLLFPEKNAVGPFVIPAGLTVLGPDGSIPIDRAQNQIRYTGQLRQNRGDHQVSTGFGVLRRQINGYETDVHRGFFSFNNDFDRDAITNLRMGTASNYLLSVGNVHRGWRLWEMQLYAGDSWRVSPKLQLQYGLRWQPLTRPTEVQGFNPIPYGSDWNNFGPALGFAYRLPGKLGVARGATGVHFGEIFTVTFQQIRFSPPHSVKTSVNAPNIVFPLGAPGTPPPVALPTVYALDRELATPYSYQYNLSWEPELSKYLKLQLGYVGSRSHKLFVMWYLNRAQPVPGIELITRTVNQRRANPAIADHRLIVNASRGYYDAARVSLVVQNWRGLTSDFGYWFSKAIDLGTGYTNTANENDSRSGRSQYEFNFQRDMKGLSQFDQTHAFLWRAAYALNTPWRQAFARHVVNGWNLSLVTLVKTGTPFNIGTGSDAPGFGNVDGNGGDRPNILDPSILGRTISHPDISRQLLPRAAFGYIRPGENQGNLGRNVFRKGRINNVNAQLSRAFALGHDMRMTFRAESINLFNTPQFAEPGFDLANPNFGQITNTLNDGR